jgi:hypothetical protein
MVAHVLMPALSASDCAPGAVFLDELVKLPLVCCLVLLNYAVNEENLLNRHKDM